MASELSFWKPGDAAPSRGKSTPKVKSGGMSKKVMNMKFMQRMESQRAAQKRSRNQMTNPMDVEQSAVLECESEWRDLSVENPHLGRRSFGGYRSKLEESKKRKMGQVKIDKADDEDDDEGVSAVEMAKRQAFTSSKGRKGSAAANFYKRNTQNKGKKNKLGR